MPLVKVFTVQEPDNGMTAAGFEIDYQWQSGNGQAVSMVMKKPAC
jgi:hypothetical protein